MSRALAFFSLLSILFCSVSCTDDSSRISDVALFISPASTDTLVIESGEKMLFSLQLQAKQGNIQRLHVVSFDSQYGERQVFDTLLSVPSAKFDLVYSAPQFSKDSVSVKLTFTAWDDAGNKADNARTVLVHNRRILVNEITGILLREGTLAGLPDALSFGDITHAFNLQTARDSTLADLYLEVDPDFTQVQFASATDTKFVRYNGFDYAGATALSIQSVYSNSIRSTILPNVLVNDVILVGHGDTAQGVFHVSNIVSGRTPAENSIQMSFKSIQ